MRPPEPRWRRRYRARTAGHCPSAQLRTQTFLPDQPGTRFPAPVLGQRLDDLQAAARLLVRLRVAGYRSAERGGHGVPDLDHQPRAVGQQADPQQRELAVRVVPRGAVGAGRSPHHVGAQLADEQFGDVCQRVEPPAAERDADEAAGEAGAGRQGSERAEIGDSVASQPREARRIGSGYGGPGLRPRTERRINRSARYSTRSAAGRTVVTVRLRQIVMPRANGAAWPGAAHSTP